MKAVIFTKGVGLNRKFFVNFQLTKEELKLHTSEEWKEILGSLVKEAEAEAIEETRNKINELMLGN